jgi:serine/threonine protein kinase
MENYHVIKKLGQGTFGTVVKARDKVNNNFVAIKSIVDYRNEDEGLHLCVIREINILGCLKHPNIILLHTVFIDTMMNLVFEFIETDLHNYIHQEKYDIHIQDTLYIMHQILEAIHFAHDRNIMHRDIKPQNILINSKGQIKIADWGSARKYNSKDRKFTLPITTIWYRAPEILFEEDHYTPMVDIWSIGCVFIDLLIGQNGVKVINGKSTYIGLKGKNDQDQLYYMTQWFGRPDHIKTWCTNLDRRAIFKRGKEFKMCFAYLKSPIVDIVSKMMVWDPEKRITTSDLLQQEIFI